MHSAEEEQQKCGSEWLSECCPSVLLGDAEVVERQQQCGLPVVRGGFALTRSFARLPVRSCCLRFGFCCLYSLSASAGSASAGSFVSADSLCSAFTDFTWQHSSPSLSSPALFSAFSFSPQPFPFCSQFPFAFRSPSSSMHWLFSVFTLYSAGSSLRCVFSRGGLWTSSPRLRLRLLARGSLRTCRNRSSREFSRAPRSFPLFPREAAAAAVTSLSLRVPVVSIRRWSDARLFLSSSKWIREVNPSSPWTRWTSDCESDSFREETTVLLLRALRDWTRLRCSCGRQRSRSCRHQRLTAAITSPFVKQ